MEHEIFQLSDAEYKQLNNKYPKGQGSSLIGKRAKAIIEYYFQRKDAGCKFSRPSNGADLKVEFSGKCDPLLLEIKGTTERNIAWQQLKVSSQHSCRMLKEELIPLYRVTDVFCKNPEIYVLIYGQDFDLVQEPRWSVRRKP